MTIKILKNKKGFTLIEIIVVLMIVGILAAIALPSYFQWITKSRAGEAFVNLDSFKNTIEICLDKNIGLEGTCANSTYASSVNFSYGFLGGAAPQPELHL